MLIDAPFADILREWQSSTPDGSTALFWVLALATVALLASRRCRSRLTVFELGVLGVTLVGAVQAVRGVIWFALAAAAILPVALDGRLTRPDVAAPSLNRLISLAGLAGLSHCARRVRGRPSSWYVDAWPERQVAAVRAATRDPAVRLWGTDGTADWLLWQIPDLRGRIAYDVRFELYGERTLDRIVDVNALRGGWRPTLAATTSCVVDDRDRLRALRREPGASIAFDDGEIAVVRGHF